MADEVLQRVTSRLYNCTCAQVFLLVKILSINHAKQQPCLITYESCIDTLTISIYFQGTAQILYQHSVLLCLLQGNGILFSFPVSIFFVFKTSCVSVIMVAKSNSLVVEQWGTGTADCFLHASLLVLCIVIHQNSPQQLGCKLLIADCRRWNRSTSWVKSFACCSIIM